MLKQPDLFILVTPVPLVTCTWRVHVLYKCRKIAPDVLPNLNLEQRLPKLVHFFFCF